MRSLDTLMGTVSDGLKARASVMICNGERRWDEARMRVDGK